MSASSQSSLPAIYGQAASEESKRLRPLGRVVEVGSHFVHKLGINLVLQCGHTLCWCCIGLLSLKRCAVGCKRQHSSWSAARPCRQDTCQIAGRCWSMQEEHLIALTQCLWMQSDAGDLESAAGDLSKAAALLVSIERHILELQADGVRSSNALCMTQVQITAGRVACFQPSADVLLGASKTASKHVPRQNEGSTDADVLQCTSLVSICATVGRPRKGNDSQLLACRQTRVLWQTARRSAQKQQPPWSGAWLPWRLLCLPGEREVLRSAAFMLHGFA